MNDNKPHTDRVIESIRAEYESSLIIPKNKPHRQFILAAVGLVAAGKTTVIGPLTERLSLLRLSNDEVRRLMKKRGMNYDHLRSIAIPIFNKYLSLGYSIALDNDCANPETVKLIDKAVKEFGLRVIWIHINPPESFVLNKIRQYTGDPWLTDGDHENLVRNYFDRKPLHAHLTMPFTFTFDTSNNITSQLDTAEKEIRDALRVEE